MTVSRISRFGCELVTDGHNNRVVDALGQNVVKFMEDFVKAPIASNNITGFTTTLVGSSTLAYTDASGGKALITTTASSGDGANIQANSGAFRFDNNSFYFGCKFQVSDATLTAFFVGLSVTDTAILTNLGKRIGFSKASGATGISLDIKKTNTTSVTNIATLADATSIILEIFYDKGAGTLKYYVNGTEYGTIDASNLPDAEIRPSIHFKTGTTAAKTMSIDWVNAFQFGRS